MARDNNFDIVRLLLALMVVLFHSDALSQVPQLEPLGRNISGELAVQGFFAISGFLIFASYERSRSLKDYALKRAARILPGYWVSTALCLAIAFACREFHVGGFLLANLSFLNFLHPAIPGVFEFNPTPVMDGALWTIKVEVMFYVAVPAIIWLCRRLHRDAVLWSLFAASTALRIAVTDSKWDVELPGQLCFFLVGSLIHYHFDFFRKYGRLLMVVAAVCFGLHLWTGWFILRPAAVGVLTLGAAMVLPVVKGPTRWGDFSYGTYVLHWPILQCVVASGLFAYNCWLGLAASLCLVAGAAAISWFVVEKPSLDRAHERSKRLNKPIPAIISG